MYKIGYRTLTLIMLCVMSAGASSQTLLDSLLENYRSLTEFEVQVEVEMYSKENLQVPSERMTLKVTATQEGQLVRANMFDALLYGDMYIYADHLERSIVYSRLDSVAEHTGHMQFGGISDLELLSSLDSVRVNINRQRNNKVICTISAPAHSRSLVELHFDAKTLLLDEVLSYYEALDGSHFGMDYPKVHTRYKGYRLCDVSLNANVSTYLSNESGQYTPTKRFKEYLLLN